jgi:hypothetical protein
MVEVAARLVLAGVLVGGSLAKLASPASSRAALATFGIHGSGFQLVSWALLIAAELGLAAGVAAGSDAAAWSAAALMATFAATLISAILRGRAGAPCACFGARSTVGWGAVARNALLAIGFAALPFLPSSEMSTDEWLALGLGIALLACAGLAVAVLALAREVGMLRLRLGSASALEIPNEGPPLGERSDVIERFEPAPSAELALAVFLSPSCRICAGLEPAVVSLARDPRLAVESFDEREEAELFAGLGVPGTPYAVVLDIGGAVLAKGTFNNLAQLESVVATALRRRSAAGVVEGFGA